MVLQMKEALRVEDPRHHPKEFVEEVESLLASGGEAYADPQHKNVYELEGRTRIYYLYLNPRGDRVQLLATWPKQVADRAAD